MHEWTEIRRKVLVEGASKRSVMAEYGMAHRTLQKILRSPEPGDYTGAERRPKPKLGPFLSVIDQILEDDRHAPPKQRHTARRIFERLRDEHGYGGGITQVRDAVARARWRFDPRRYLALLERKPGAFDHARPLEGWRLPECFLLLRRRLEADLGTAGTREFIRVLRLLEQASVAELAGAVAQALSIGATGSDAVACILHHRQERPVGLFSLDGHPQLKLFAIDPPDLGAYRVLAAI